MARKTKTSEPGRPCPKRTSSCKVAKKGYKPVKGGFVSATTGKRVTTASAMTTLGSKTAGRKAGKSKRKAPSAASAAYAERGTILMARKGEALVLAKGVRARKDKRGRTFYIDNDGKRVSKSKAFTRRLTPGRASRFAK